jgi:hypothetical protein
VSSAQFLSEVCIFAGEVVAPAVCDNGRTFHFPQFIFKYVTVIFIIIARFISRNSFSNMNRFV